MRAWVVDEPAPIDAGPLRAGRARACPSPAAGQVRVRVTCCGVCRTDLHLAEGDLPPRRPQVTPGHEVVGVGRRARARARRGSRSASGSASPGWARTDGTCRYCRRGDENLCVAPTFTGWDVDGGYADACLVDEAFAYRAARRRSTTSRPRRCCAPGSSATARCAPPPCRPAAASASTASAAART